MSYPSVPGALFGKLIQHRAALASTERLTGAPIDTAAAGIEKVAELGRGTGELPYRVIHDNTVMRPYGRYAVYIGAQRIGSQLSRPSLEDCQRMENPPPPAPSLEFKLSKGVRLALGIATPEERRVKSEAEKRAKTARKAGAIRAREHALAKIFGAKP